MPKRVHARTPRLQVVIGCDCDPDRPQYGGVRYDSRAPLKWRGVRKGIPQAREVADRIRDDFGNPPKITWCVRSDLQMEEIYGDCAWPYAEFADLWKSVAERGDEIAWHPHLWRWSDEHGCWYQETEDGSWIRACLRQGYRALSGHMDGGPTASRMGWEFHNNMTMHEINDLGIQLDFSAVPGRFTPGRRDKWGSVFNCCVDWRNTPEHLYTPSASDYRREAGLEGKALSVMELPMSILRSRLLSTLASVRQATQCHGLDKLRRLFSSRRGSTISTKAYITIHHSIFSRLAAARLREAKKYGHALLVTAFHADEMLTAHDGPRVLYARGHFESNLECLRILSLRAGVALRFLPASRTIELPGHSQTYR